MRRSDETGGARMSSFLKPLSAGGQSALRRSGRDGMGRLDGDSQGRDWREKSLKNERLIMLINFQGIFARARP
jgi:hypothetical protein